MSRATFLAETDGLVATGEAIVADPQWERFRSWLMATDQLLERVWGYGYFGDGRLVDVHIRRLRTKIEADPEFFEQERERDGGSQRHRFWSARS